MASAAELFAMAVRHYQASDLRQAEQLCRLVLDADAGHGPGHQLLGILANHAGRHEMAIALLRRAAALSPTDANCHFNLGVVLAGQGNTADAIACYRQTLALNPNHAQAHNNLGNALKSQGQFQEAVVCYQHALRCNPRYANAHFNLGNALNDQGLTSEAALCYRQTIQLAPNHADAYLNLGASLKTLGQLDEAVARLREASRLNSQSIDAHTNLGLILKEKGQVDEAIACFRKALRLDARHVESLVRLGSALSEQGRVRAAIACYRRAEAIKPDYVAAASNVLDVLHFVPEYDSAAIAEEHRRWRLRHAEYLEKSAKFHPNDPSPDRRLRIGYVSPDFHSHCQAFFTVPLFQKHDHRQFEIFGYSDVLRPDGITDRLQSLADSWRSIADLDDDQVADMIRQDRIDILVDLTMHMAGNRLLVFARKPAPVQISWLAYPGTTGLKAIDYRLSDPYLDPPGCDTSCYSEETARLPDTFWCYHPLTNAPDVNTLPALENGYATFGCLNNFCKVNDLSLRLWAKVLRAAPSSRLILLAPEGQSRARVARILEKEGIAAERLRFVPRQPRPDYLKTYHEIDLGLDTLPYNGHTTSLDSTWMGVPVITLVGQTVVGRAGVSQLTNLGLEDLIALTEDEFITIARKLVRDLPQLGVLRAILRERMERSPLMDAPRFARGLEGVYRDVWRRWCARQKHLQLTIDN